jgi:hypothetical protein
MLNGKLGKAPKKEDKRTLKLSNYYNISQLPPIPDEWDWIEKSGITTWGMMRNDVDSDCVEAAGGHIIMLHTALNGDPFVPSDQDILDTYAFTGFNPSTGQNDNGTVELDYLKYMQTTGTAGHKWGPFVAVNPLDQQEVQLAIYLLGALLGGTELPLAEQGQSEWADPPVDNNTKDLTAGSWGGHGIPFMSYNKQGTRTITWGAPLMVDWSYFLGKDATGSPYISELYGFVSPDWVSGAKAAPNGFALNDLLSDLQKVQA